MAKEQKKAERVSVTLSTGTKVTASKEVAEKLKQASKPAGK